MLQHLSCYLEAKLYNGKALERGSHIIDKKKHEKGAAER